MFKWRKKQRARAAPVERARARAKLPPPPPADQGPRRVTLPGGVVEEYSAATGRSIILPSTPARRGVDVRPSAPGWGGWTGLRRWFGC
jgi:hypothetical protein